MTNNQQTLGEKLKQEFPILAQNVNHKPLVYLDNGATTQKPQAVIDAIKHYYQQDNANIHRAVHQLAERATIAYENARDRIQKFVNAKQREEIIFTRGTTESINLVAQTWGRNNIKAGDEILISIMEHHANIVPWQMLAAEKNAVVKFIPICADGSLDLEKFEQLLTPKTKLLAITHISNVLGTVNPIEMLIQKAHEYGAICLIDGAQAVAHQVVDVQALNADFYVFSGHKLYAPTGTGILYGKRDLLENMPPFLGGGDMIQTVSLNGFTVNELPAKFEAGTPHIAGFIGLGAAVQWLNQIGLNHIAHYEHELMQSMRDKIQTISGIQIFGDTANKSPIFSFHLANTHAHDVATLLSRYGVAVRSGHHCAMPLMQHFGVNATARASFACYNTEQDIDVFIAALVRVQKMLA